MRFDRSHELQARAHRLIPGGAHTYAKGDDQFPIDAPGFIARGSLSHVWDVDGNEFIEYGSGLRAVTLGHAYPEVVEAVQHALALGTNFSRPHPLEVELAERLAALIPCAEMVKFSKNGSDVLNAAVRLARAYTGRDLIARCADQPFFSFEDWFIGSTAMPAGIPRAVRDLTVSFGYNDAASLARLFDEHPGAIACVVLEAATAVEPQEGFLQAVRDLCDRHGAVLILDEMITGFRWHLGGAQTYYGVRPDLATFGKALANGFSVSALAGRRDILRLGGLDHDQERVFLLSTTHGAEVHALAAARATLDVYEREPVIDRLWTAGAALGRALEAAARDAGVGDHFRVLGRPCNLVYAALDADKQPSQAFRTLVLQEMIARGVICPSFVIGYSHSDEDVARTAEAARGAFVGYRQALERGIDHVLRGRPVKPVFRGRN